jgi:hypothetical protein
MVIPLAESDNTIQEKLLAVEAKCVQIEDMQITIWEARMKKQCERNLKYKW